MLSFPRAVARGHEEFSSFGARFPNVIPVSKRSSEIME